MDNFQKWCAYTENLVSPNSYIAWSWLYTITASLQRRVWIGTEPQQLFPNIYVILVGNPGVGKGLCLKEVISLLKHWRYTDKIENAEYLAYMNSNGKQEAADILKTNEQDRKANEFQGYAKKAPTIPPELIPVAADATTYEALVHSMVDCYDVIMTTRYDETLKKNIARPDGHASSAFVLQELSSLMRKRTEDVVNFLLGMYDCPKDYKYITKSQGSDRVRKGCINLMAGTTPSFMASTFDDRLTDEGFNSRTFYIYAARNRKNSAWISDKTPSQLAFRHDLLNHIRKLTSLYGEVKISQDVKDRFQEWWNQYENDKIKRANTSLKLVPYYSRKNIHILKLAMAHHFSEHITMELTWEDIEWAITFLEKEEKFMHLGIALEGKTDESRMSRKVLEYLASGEKSYVSILMETHYIGGKELLNKALDFLKDTMQVSSRIERDEELNESKEMYKLI